MGISATLAQWNTAVEQYVPLMLEIIVIMIGIQILHVAYRTFHDRSNPCYLGTSAFWAILGFVFIMGSYIPHKVSGALICVLGLLTLFKQVQIGTVPETADEVVERRAEKHGYTVFLPVLALGVTALFVAQLLPATGQVVIGFGALLGAILMVIYLKPEFSDVLDQNSRMTQQVSTTGILPQVLAALGSVFTAAGVGDVIAEMIGGVVPEGSRLFGVLAYVLGMFIFTIIMGNAFAAFAVITAGVGIPFVFALGGDPVVASALALTAGYCGTLITPMAGNFNALPAALLEMQDEYGVIRQQVFVALAMLLAHIPLMYFWAF